MTPSPDASALAALKTALEDIKRDLENCDWRCTRCGHDYGMTETDIYLYAEKALKAHNPPASVVVGEEVQASIDNLGGLKKWLLDNGYGDKVGSINTLIEAISTLQTKLSLSEKHVELMRGEKK